MNNKNKNKNIMVINALVIIPVNRAEKFYLY